MNEPSSSARPAHPSSLTTRGSLRRVARLAAKELREILRDRRTIITLILMPLLVYPLLSILFQQVVLRNAGSNQGQPEYRIGVDGETAEKVVNDYLSLGHLLLEAEQPKEIPKNDQSIKLPGLPDSSERPIPMIGAVDDLKQKLETGEVDIGILVERTGGDFYIENINGRRVPLTHVKFELLHCPNSPLSQRALRFAERCLVAVNDRYLRQNRVEVAAISKRTAVAGEKGATVSLTTLFPLILILMTITGAVYPAIDLTAGERERGTMETLIAAPVPRLSLLLGKYVAVMTVALLTATANVIAMSITVLSTGLGKLLFGEPGMQLGTVIQVFALMILFAAFFSAVLLAITSFARSFKEAQAYLIPIMLVAIAPGLLSLKSDIVLQGPLVITPLVNIVLLGRDMFEGKADLGLAIIIVFSTVLYALAAIALAARIFGSDAILYGSHSSWRGFFRRSKEPRDAVTPTGAMLCLAVVFPMYYLLASIIVHQGPMPDPIPEGVTLSTQEAKVIAMEEVRAIVTRLVQTTLISVLLFAVIPYVASRWNNVSFRHAFQVMKASILAFAGAMLLGFVLWPFAYELVLLSHDLGIAILSDDMFMQAKVIIEKLQSTGSPVLILATLALAPAVLEELFFRGFLMSSLRSRTSAKFAIVFSAVLFGAFHIVASHGLAIERFFPSTFMGLILGWICFRTGSVLPGMLLHMCHNSLLLLLGHYYEDLQAAGLGKEEGSHLPWFWLLAAACGVSAGIVLIVYATRHRATKLNEKPALP